MLYIVGIIITGCFMNKFSGLNTKSIVYNPKIDYKLEKTSKTIDSKLEKTSKIIHSNPNIDSKLEKTPKIIHSNPKIVSKLESIDSKIENDTIVINDLNWLWTDCVFDIGIDAFNKLLFDNKSKLDKKLFEAIDIDPQKIKKTKWNNGKRTRLITIPKSLLHKEVQAICKDVYTISKPGKIYVIDETFHSNGLPYGSSWDSLTRRILIDEGGKCRYRVSSEIVFIKKVMFKNIITNRFKTHTQTKHITTEPTILKYLSQ